jgi:hypothetical protein
MQSNYLGLIDYRYGYIATFAMTLTSSPGRCCPYWKRRE